jgi:hypothetical protein
MCPCCPADTLPPPSRIPAAAVLPTLLTPAQELELRFLYLSNPRLGSWLEDLAGVTELRGLRLLRLAGEHHLIFEFMHGISSSKAEA